MNCVRAAGAPIRPHSEGNVMWIVMVSVKGGWKAYSVHSDEAVAREWAKCLEYGGQDTAICRMDGDTLGSAYELLKGSD